MDSTVGPKGVLWGTIGAELIAVVFDLRYMIICSFALILADLWWGHSENSKRLAKAKAANDKALIEQYKWRHSRAWRRSANKIVDYLTYLVVGALMGMAITEPMEICSHVITAALGLLIGCGCEIASIWVHVAYVKFDIEVSMVEGWKSFIRFMGKLIKVKSNEIGEAVEDLGRNGHHSHHHGEMPDHYDEEQNMED